MMTIQLNDLIKIIDGALDPEVCNNLIQLFESDPEHHEVIDNDKKPSFTQFNLTEHYRNTEIHNYVLSKIIHYKNEYYEFVDKRVFPEDNQFEQLRIKRYDTTGDQMFDTHVDVMDHSSSRRYLSYLFYLNDVETGGETVFDDLTISPRCGRLVMFPPMWMFPHRGNSPGSNAKYILTAYLHYK